MARTRKAIQPLNLHKYDVLIDDKGYRSDYFKVTQFDGYLYGGRNAILISGAGVLRPRSKILVEILNKDGGSVYSSPVSAFVEGSSRLIHIEVYDDTPIGQGKLVILGCADSYIDGSSIPDQWKSKYNVRWMSDVVISPLIENKTPIRFVNNPSMVVEEKFYFAPSSSMFNESIQVPIDAQLSAKYYNVYPNGYLLRLPDPDITRFYSKQLGGIITGSIEIDGVRGPETASVRLPLTKIYNRSLAETTGNLITTDKKTIILGGDISASNSYITNLNPFGDVSIKSNLSLQYNELVTEETGSVLSFAKIRLVDLSTISGEINKIRFSYKSSTDPGDYSLLGQIDTSVADLLQADTGSKSVHTGNFRDVIIEDYWFDATMSLQRNDINYSPPDYYYSSSLVLPVDSNIKQSCVNLLDSINATPIIQNDGYINNVSYFIGNRDVNSVTLFPRSEYTLSFDAVVLKQSGSIELNQQDYSIDVYLTTIPDSTGKILETNKLGQLIGSVIPDPKFTRQNFETVYLNFTPKIKDSGEFGIRFVIYGGFWNISNVSLKTAQEPFFSPDEIDALLPNLDYRNSLLTFKAEYLDINNNSVGIQTISLPTYFTGSESSHQVLNNVVFGKYSEKIINADILNSTMSLDISKGNVFMSTIDQDTYVLIENPSTVPLADSFTLICKYDGPHDITWDPSIIWPESLSPDISSVSGSTDIFAFVNTSNGDHYYGIFSGKGFPK